MICLTHTLTHSHRLYLFVEECKWVCWKSGRAWIWNEKKVLLCKISLLLLLLLYGKMKIYAPTFYIIKLTMSLCIRIYVCLYSTQLNSTRRDSTQLAHESAALSVSHARHSVFKQPSETTYAWWPEGRDGWTAVGDLNPSAISQRT